MEQFQPSPVRCRNIAWADSAQSKGSHEAVKRISLSGSNINSDSVTNLWRIYPRVEEVDLSWTGADQVVLRSLANLSDLKYCLLEGVSLGDAATASLVSLRQLEGVYINSGNISDQALLAFTNIVTLKHLHVRGVTNSQSIITQLMSALTNTVVYK